MWSSSSSSRSKKNKSGSSRSSSINEDSALKMFQKYADPDDPNAATIEGIGRLAEDLGMDPLEDIRILVLLWKMEGSPSKPAQISREEWLGGCNKLEVDTLAKFQKIIPSLDTGFLCQSDFKEFYKFCFNFNRQGTHKTLDKDLVIALLSLVLVGRVPSDRLETFQKFLTSTEDYTRITQDQWVSWLDFCNECEDLSKYDEATSAWPVLIDEYVEYMEKQQGK